MTHIVFQFKKLKILLLLLSLSATFLLASAQNSPIQCASDPANLVFKSKLEPGASPTQKLTLTFTRYSTDATVEVQNLSFPIGFTVALSPGSSNKLSGPGDTVRFDVTYTTAFGVISQNRFLLFSC